MEDWNW